MVRGEYVLSQHAEEAAFLWLLRDRAVYAPHYALSDLRNLDGRVAGHLDGLRFAGEHGWQVCCSALLHEEAGEAFLAAVLALDDGDKGRVETVLEAGSRSREVCRGVAEGLSWVPYEKASAQVGRLSGSRDPNMRGIALAGSVAQRRDPGEGLVRALMDESEPLRDRGLRAVGELGRTDLLPRVAEELQAEDIGCRFSAAWSAALLGDGAAAIDALKGLAKVAEPHGEEATRIACRRMDLPAANEWEGELQRTPGGERLAVVGAGAIGDPAAVPWLVERMRIPVLARVAGEAFTMITGVDIAYEDLEGEWPEGLEAGPTENPEDEDVEMDPDENLPWPDPALIEAWWVKNRGRFPTGARYLVGQPIAYQHLQQVLRTGFQRQRAAAAIELAMMKPGQPLFEVRAPAFRQRELLGLGRPG
jgi:uncharacterized protein (TIGR02270 family)